MVVIAGDSHKRTHTFVAVDEVGRRLAEKTVPATSEGHLDAIVWAERWQERTWAIEDCRHLTRRLEADLLAGGEAVERVPTRLMAAERRGDRQRGKSDPIDALAVARAALREPALPVPQLDGPARELKLLVDHREDLVRERTRMQARLRWHLHELFPGLVIPSRGLRRRPHLHRAGTTARRRGRHRGPHRSRAGGAHRRAHKASQCARARDQGAGSRCRAVAARAPRLRRAVGGQDRGRDGRRCPLQVQGGVRRWNGTAPIPVWSGSTNFRLNRGGTARSTPPSTASLSPKPVASDRATPTSTPASSPATRRRMPCDSCAGGSPTKCSAASSWTRQPRCVLSGGW